MRVDRALERGEEIDDELFYEYIHDFPSYKKKLSKMQQFREKEKEQKKQEEERMRQLDEKFKANEIKQKEIFEENRMF